MFAGFLKGLQIRTKKVFDPHPKKIGPCPDCGSRMFVRKRGLAPSKMGPDGTKLHVYRTTISCADCAHCFWRGTEESAVGLGFMDEVFQSD